jgi:UDP-N-acetyl-2-amino-2-deoxyglucuronate dehydrogenase
MTRTRIALIGLGMAVTPHARSLVDLADRVEVAHAFSPSAARRAAFGERVPFPLAESFDAVLADETVEAVVILTPPNTHLDLVRRAAQAGKHVLLEKPLEISLERAEAVVAACREAGVKLGMVLQHRFRPAGMQLRKILGKGELGRIVSGSTVIRLWRPQSYYDEPGRGTLARDGGGVLLTQGIHTLDLYLSLAGRPAEVFAYVTTTPLHRMETEDLVAAAVRFEAGPFGTIEATTAAAPGFPERIDIVGERGTAQLAGTALDIAWSDGRRTEIGPDQTPGGTGADPMAFPHDYHRDLIADFLGAIQSGREPAVSGEEALKVHRLIAALIESGRLGRPVRLAA